MTLMKSKCVPRNRKISVHTTVIRPTVTDASKTWILNRAEEEQLVDEEKELREGWKNCIMGHA